MKKLCVLFFVLIVFGCSDLPDDKQVKMLVRDTAVYVRQSDEAYKTAMISIQSHNAGKPLYQIAEEVQEQVNILNTMTSLMADIAVNRSTDIQLDTAQEALKAGATGIYNIYKVKHNFLAEAASAINTGSQVAIANVTNKYSNDLAQSDGILILAMSELARAKTLVGLPNDLSEFE